MAAWSFVCETFVVAALCLATCAEKDLLENLHPNKGNPSELNDFLVSVLKAKEDFKWIRDTAAKYLQAKRNSDFDPPPPKPKIKPKRRRSDRFQALLDDEPDDESRSERSSWFGIQKRKYRRGYRPRRTDRFRRGLNWKGKYRRLNVDVLPRGEAGLRDVPGNKYEWKRQPEKREVAIGGKRFLHFKSIDANAKNEGMAENERQLLMDEIEKVLSQKTEPPEVEYTVSERLPTKLIAGRNAFGSNPLLESLKLGARENSYQELLFNNKDDRSREDSDFLEKDNNVPKDYFHPRQNEDFRNFAKEAASGNERLDENEIVEGYKETEKIQSKPPSTTLNERQNLLIDDANTPTSAIEQRLLGTTMYQTTWKPTVAPTVSYISDGRFQVKDTQDMVHTKKLKQLQELLSQYVPARIKKFSGEEEKEVPRFEPMKVYHTKTAKDYFNENNKDGNFRLHLHLKKKQAPGKRRRHYQNRNQEGEFFRSRSLLAVNETLVRTKRGITDFLGMTNDEDFSEDVVYDYQGLDEERKKRRLDDIYIDEEPSFIPDVPIKIGKKNKLNVLRNSLNEAQSEDESRASGKDKEERPESETTLRPEVTIQEDPKKTIKLEKTIETSSTKEGIVKIAITNVIYKGEPSKSMPADLEEDVQITGGKGTRKKGQKKLESTTSRTVARKTVGIPREEAAEFETVKDYLDAKKIHERRKKKRMERRRSRHYRESQKREKGPKFGSKSVNNFKDVIEPESPDRRLHKRNIEQKETLQGHMADRQFFHNPDKFLNSNVRRKEKEEARRYLRTLDRGTSGDNKAKKEAIKNVVPKRTAPTDKTKTDHGKCSKPADKAALEKEAKAKNGKCLLKQKMHQNPNLEPKSTHDNALVDEDDEEKNSEDYTQMHDVLSGHLTSMVVDAIFAKVITKSRLHSKFGSGLNRHSHKDRVKNLDELRNAETADDVKQTEHMLHQIMIVLNRIILEQVRRRTCHHLAPDLHKFLVYITKLSKETQEKTPDSYPLPTMKNGDIPQKTEDDQADFLFFNPGGLGPDQAQDKEIEKKIKMIERLLEKYDRMSENCKVKVEAVRDYLKRHLEMLKSCLKSHAGGKVEPKIATNSTNCKQKRFQNFDAKKTRLAQAEINSIIREKMQKYLNEPIAEPKRKANLPEGGKKESKREVGEMGVSEKYKKLLKTADELRKKKETEEKLGKLFSKEKRQSDEAGDRGEPELSQVAFETPRIYSLD